MVPPWGGVCSQPTSDLSLDVVGACMKPVWVFLGSYCPFLSLTSSCEIFMLWEFMEINSFLWVIYGNSQISNATYSFKTPQKGHFLDNLAETEKTGTICSMPNKNKLFPIKYHIFSRKQGT